MCDIALATGGYSMTWIGFAERDAEKRVRLVARAGVGTDLLDGFPVRWDESERAQGPTGTAIRTKSIVVFRDGDPRLKPWQEFLSDNQHRAVIALPLINEAAGVFGSLTLASEDAEAFGPDEVELLTQLASDMAYGTAALRDRQARREAEHRLRAHASRLEALWKIVSNPNLSGDDLTLAMLAEATTAIRPGAPFMGALFRIASDEIVVEAVAETPEYVRSGGGVGDIQAGLRVALAGTAVERILQNGNGTHAWDDLEAAFDTPRVQQNRWRSTIATTFQSGRATYLLWFASVSTTGAWESHDHAYIEIVAAFFSSHAQMRWQFDQLQYHQTHDVLTGILNRSQFRSRARSASLGMESYAIIALNVNGFGEINETYGNMIGDALLVEVAAGVSERAASGEIAGRLGGDIFAVFIPEPRSLDYVRERTIHFAERFRHPFSTGDREGN
jgi:GGDEF domain-containing protein